MTIKEFVIQLVAEKRLLIMYIYDRLGFRKGAVVAVRKVDGPQYTVAASLVNRKDDMIQYRGDLFNVPVVTALFDCGFIEYDAISVLQKAFLNDDSLVIYQPDFNRYVALETAIERALEEGHVAEDVAPHDKELQETVKKMRIRAAKYFAPEVTE